MLTSPKLKTTILAPFQKDNPILVVAPSLGTSAVALWSDAAKRLADNFGVVGVDLPGHGASQTVAPIKDMSLLAKALLAGIEDAIGSGKPFFFAGVSVSGCIGLQLSLDAADQLAGAAILNSAAKIGEHAAWMERAAFVRNEGTKAMRESSPGRWFAPGFVEKNPARVEALLDSLVEADADGYAGVCEALASFDVRSALGTIACPFIVIGGENDVATPPEQQRMIAEKIPGARVEILLNAGHLAPAEKPDEVAKLLIDYFKA